MPAGVDYAPLSLPQRYPKLLHQEGTITFAKNTNSNPLRIDQSGLLLGLIISFKGTWTTGTTPAPTLTNTSPYGIVSRVQLSVGGGVGRLVDVTGYELNVLERTREQDYVDTSSTPNALSTANVWTFDLFLPVCNRDGDTYANFSDWIGALYTGDPQVTCNLVLSFADENAVASALGGVAVVLAGTFTITSVKVDVPQPSQDPTLWAAISWNHILIEEYFDTTVTASGNKVFLMSTNEARVYLRFWIFYGDTNVGGSTNPVWKNGVLTTLDLNIVDYLHPVEAIAEQPQLAIQLRRYATALPVGSYVIDFSASMYRSQWLPVDRISLLKLVPNFTSPGANAVVRVVQESVVPSPLARKWGQQLNLPVRAA
jgi:hypothetical protein